MTDANMTATESSDDASGVITGETASNAAPKNPEALRQAVIDAEQRCATLRAKLAALVTERGRARAMLATTIGQWSGLDRMTPEANARQYIAHELRERARIAVHGPDAAKQSRPADSAIDRACVFSTGGSADDHARRHMKSGFRRSSYPASMRGAKLPSSRG